jgi:hypothetical protein
MLPLPRARHSRGADSPSSCSESNELTATRHEWESPPSRRLGAAKLPVCPLPGRTIAMPSHGGPLPCREIAMPSHGGALLRLETAMPSRGGALLRLEIAMPSHGGALLRLEIAMPSHGGALPRRVLRFFAQKSAENRLYLWPDAAAHPAHPRWPYMGVSWATAAKARDLSRSPLPTSLHAG